MAQIVVEFNRVVTSNGGGGKSIKKLSKSWKIFEKPKKPQRSDKIAKAIGLE